MRWFPEMTAEERAYARAYELDAIADSASDTTPNEHHGPVRAPELNARTRAVAGSTANESKAA